jgi:hypothetical protein
MISPCDQRDKQRYQRNASSPGWGDYHYEKEKTLLRTCPSKVFSF